MAISARQFLGDVGLMREKNGIDGLGVKDSAAVGDITFDHIMTVNVYQYGGEENDHCECYKKTLMHHILLITL